mgnify:CR=1 FL=1
MIKGSAPPMTAGRSFFVFRRKNSEKLRKTGKERLRTQKSSLIPCSSQIMRKFAAICNAHFAKWRIL